MIIRALRRSLSRIKSRHGFDVSVPQHERLARYVIRLLEGKTIDDCPFTPAKLRQALRSHDVAEVANQRLVKLFGARSRRGAVQRAIRDMVNAELD